MSKKQFLQFYLNLAEEELQELEENEKQILSIKKNALG